MARYLSPSSPDFLFQLNDLICFVFALPLNCLLLWLIENKSPKKLRDYGKILKLNVYVDIFFITLYYASGIVSAGFRHLIK